MLEIAEHVTIDAPAERVLTAFLDPRDLAAWWQVERSVTVGRPLVPMPSSGDPPRIATILGPLGGAFHGTVMEFRAGQELFVADAFWNPPEGDPVGPMALEVRCTAEGAASTGFTVRLSGEDGPRWQRYFAVMRAGWPRALAELKRYLETETFNPQCIKVSTIRSGRAPGRRRDHRRLGRRLERRVASAQDGFAGRIVVVERDPTYVRLPRIAPWAASASSSAPR